MHYLTIKTELSYADAERIVQDLLVQDYNVLVKDTNVLDEEYNQSVLAALRIVLEYYGGEQALQRIEPQQQEMEL